MKRVLSNVEDGGNYQEQSVCQSQPRACLRAVPLFAFPQISPMVRSKLSSVYICRCGNETPTNEMFEQLGNNKALGQHSLGFPVWALHQFANATSYGHLHLLEGDLPRLVEIEFLRLLIDEPRRDVKPEWGKSKTNRFCSPPDLPTGRHRFCSPQISTTEPSRKVLTVTRFDPDFR